MGAGGAVTRLRLRAISKRRALRDPGAPLAGVEILRSRGYPDDVLRAILSHAPYTGVPRDTQMAKTLFAVDELTGLITASALVRPSKSVMDLDARSCEEE